MKSEILPQSVKSGFTHLLQPVVDVFVRLEVAPNVFTTVGLLLNVLAAVAFALGQLRLGAVLLLLGGIFDTFDGRVARETGRVTRFGALYDSTLDRYSEIFMFFGMGYYFLQTGRDWVVFVILLALGGSLMVSYVRARAEGLGFECKIGIMQRAERVVLLALGALIHEVTLITAIVLVAVFANVTAMQRLHYIWAMENGRKKEGLPEGQSFNGD